MLYVLLFLSIAGMCRLLHRNATYWINILNTMYLPDSHGFIRGFRSQVYILLSKYVR